MGFPSIPKWGRTVMFLIFLTMFALIIYILYDSLKKQGNRGFMDYNDASTANNQIDLQRNEWTTIPNDGQGPATKRQFKPSHVTDFIDTSTGALRTIDLELGDAILVRNDFYVTSQVNNTRLELRYLIAPQTKNEYALEQVLPIMSDGAKEYHFALPSYYIYMGDEPTLTSLTLIQVRANEPCTLRNAGSVIQLV